MWYGNEIWSINNIKHNKFSTEVMQKMRHWEDKHGQNIWNKVKKSCKTGQDKKSFVSTFTGYFYYYCQDLISGRRSRNWEMSAPKFEIFPTFPNSQDLKS